MLLTRTKTVRVPQPDRSGPFKFTDFCGRVEDGQKADLIDGVIFMASPDNTDAGRQSSWLQALLFDYCEHFELGDVFGSRIAFRLDEKNSPEPDIAVVLTENRARVKRGYVDGPADVAFEIVSPESVQRDYERKRTLYAKFGVPEYWIIDEELHRVTLLQLVSRTYKEARPRKGALVSKVLPGFWLRPEWTWRKPRPRKADVLAEILAGVPR